MPYELISVDDHIIEPPDVWTDRLPSKYQESAPRVVELEGGREAWLVNGTPSTTMGLNAVAGRPQEEWDMDPLNYAGMIEACYNPSIRAKELEVDGVVGSVCFPSLFGFSGSRILEFKDRELALLLCQAYNDWVFEGWCAAAPNLFIPMMTMPLWDTQLCADEVRRTAAMGGRCITFPEDPGGLGLGNLWEGSWDPLWDALSETGMVVNCHIGTAGNMPRPTGAKFHVSIMLAQVTAAIGMVNLIESPVLRDFPKLQFCFSEGGLGWIAAQLERCDRMWERHKHWSSLDGLLPSEIFRRNILGTFVDDQIGIDLRYHIGVERIMWESDFPHVETPWPHSQDVIKRLMHDVPDDEAELMTSGNARRVYNWPKTV
jgi:predicted TIM-barrel fold metal-dependent hydrolase